MTTAANGYGRYTFYASAAVVVFSIVGSIIWVGGIANEVAQNKIALMALAQRLSAAESETRANQITSSQMQRDAREVETQFCASDIVRNLMHANDMRTTAMLWRKSFGTPYPTDNPYYPTICNRPVIGQ